MATSSVEVVTSNYTLYGYSSDGTRIEQPSFEALDATTANIAIEGVSSGSSSGLAVGIGNSSHTVAAGTGSATYNHNLGVTPKRITVWAVQYLSAGTEIHANSFGIAVSPSLNKKTGQLSQDSTGDIVPALQNASTVIIQCKNTAGSATATADLTAWTTTTFTLNWTVISGATCEFWWEVLS